MSMFLYIVAMILGFGGILLIVLGWIIAFRVKGGGRDRYSGAASCNLVGAILWALASFIGRLSD